MKDELDKSTQFKNKIKHPEKNKNRFKSERNNIFTEETNTITLSSNDNKIIQSINSIDIYAYGRRKDLVSEKEGIKQYKNG